MHNKGIDFIAIDFETATSKRDSICEVGICIVRDGVPVETKSWLVRPERNMYYRVNMGIHGILPEHTRRSPGFVEVWTLLQPYLKTCPLLVAHNAAFDMSCIRAALDKYQLPKPECYYLCSCQWARHLYPGIAHGLEALCDAFGIPHEMHHRAGHDAEMCARLFLKELADMECQNIVELQPYFKLL